MNENLLGHSDIACAFSTVAVAAKWHRMFFASLDTNSIHPLSVSCYGASLQQVKCAFLQTIEGNYSHPFY
jgi:hypothetical protein